MIDNRYQLSEKEKGFILGIILNTRNDYLKKNKYSKMQFVELEDITLIETKEAVEDIIEKKFDMSLKANNIYNIFKSKELSKIVQALSEEQRSVLFLYSKGKTDKEIAEKISKSMHATNKIKNRVFNKIKDKFEEERNGKRNI